MKLSKLDVRGYRSAVIDWHTELSDDLDANLLKHMIYTAACWSIFYRFKTWEENFEDV